MGAQFEALSYDSLTGGLSFLSSPRSKDGGWVTRSVKPWDSSLGMKCINQSFHAAAAEAEHERHSSYHCPACTPLWLVTSVRSQASVFCQFRLPEPEFLTMAVSSLPHISLLSSNSRRQELADA